jgi:hypothetical protein
MTLHTITPVPDSFTQDEFLGMDWRDKAYWASRGQLRAILVNALGIAPRDGEAAFLGRPTFTSDGFAICDFRTAEGERHMGAFVAAGWQIRRNVEGLADHRLGHKPLFTPEERAQYLDATNWWCGR